MQSEADNVRPCAFRATFASQRVLEEPILTDLEVCPTSVIVF